MSVDTFSFVSVPGAGKQVSVFRARLCPYGSLLEELYIHRDLNLVVRLKLCELLTKATHMSIRGVSCMCLCVCVFVGFL